MEVRKYEKEWKECKEYSREWSELRLSKQISL
jgi:hypothetical protein